MDHTQLARDYYARRLRAEGATTAVLRLINYHCHSFTFAIRRVRVPNIVPYKASWFADHLCVNGPAITPLLQRHTSSVTERKIGEKRAEGRERRNQIQTHDPNFHSIVPAFRYIRLIYNQQMVVAKVAGVRNKKTRREEREAISKEFGRERLSLANPKSRCYRFTMLPKAKQINFQVDT